MLSSKQNINFKRALLERGLKQRDLAEKFGVSRSEVSRWAHGLPPRQDLRTPVARHLKTPARELWPHAYEQTTNGGGSK